MESKVLNANNDPILDKAMERILCADDCSPSIVHRAQELHEIASRLFAYREMSRAALLLLTLGVESGSETLIKQSTIVYEQMVAELAARPIMEVVSGNELQ